MSRTTGVVAIALVAVLSFIAGTFFRANPSRQASARKVLYYVDPMHPAYRSDKPGIAPDCGMDLEPVYEGEENVAATHAPDGTISISSEKQQLIGVRTAIVEAAAGKYVLKLPGRVVTDERRIYRVTSAVDGWIVDAGSTSTGSWVKKGDKLADFYSPDFLGAQQAFFFALQALDRFQGKETPEQIQLTEKNIEQYTNNLRILGMSQEQIAELRRTRQATQRIWMLSPVDGFITTRNISLGQRFERGTELFRIADLSTVWIVADAYDRDARYIRPRVAAHVVQTGMGKVMHGSVSTVPPQFDPATRTLKFRIDVQNPSLELRPDMFVNVDLEVDTPSRLSVPVDAVLDSGTQQRIFVARGDGHFESRTVRVGARTGDQVEITDGLRVGEEIVVSANFLLDSESRMRAVSARADTGTSSKDLICGMDVSAEKAQKDGLVSTYRGTTYYFCSRGCKTKFDAAPEKYVPRSSVASLSTTAGNTNPQ